MPADGSGDSSLIAESRAYLALRGRKTCLVAYARMLLRVFPHARLPQLLPTDRTRVRGNPGHARGVPPPRDPSIGVAAAKRAGGQLWGLGGVPHELRRSGRMTTTMRLGRRRVRRAGNLSQSRPRPRSESTAHRGFAATLVVYGSKRRAPVMSLSHCSAGPGSFLLVWMWK